MKPLLTVLLLMFGLFLGACDNNEDPNPEEDLEPDERGCSTVTFEFVPGNDVVEGLAINTQYEELLFTTFSLEDGTDPVIAQTGAPSTAFEPNDNPVGGQNIGSFFLTDDGFITEDASPLIVDFSVPVDSASGFVLDIDGGETFTIQAFNASGEILDEVVVSDGDPGTGSRAATPWGFSRATPDVVRVRFEGVRPTGIFGLGFDNFTTCAPGRLP